MGDDSQIPAAWRGLAKIQHGELKNVFYVPSLAANLLCVCQINHIGSPKRVTFNLDSVEIPEKDIGKLITKGTANHSTKAYEFSYFFLFHLLQIYWLMLTTLVRFGMRDLGISISNISNNSTMIKWLKVFLHPNFRWSMCWLIGR